MTHDYKRKRHERRCIARASSVLDGTVIGRNMHGIAIRSSSAFSTAIEEQVPAGKTISHAFSTTTRLIRSKGPPNRSTATQMDVPFQRQRPALLVVGSTPSRAFLCDPDKAPTEARRLSIRHRPSSRHPPLPRRDNQQSQPSYGQPIPTRSSPRCGAGTSVRFDPLVTA